MKKGLLPLLIVITALLITARLFYLQIIDEKYKLQAENNAIKTKYEFPERGYIFDRNGELMVANQPSYDIMVVPREMKDLDTLAFCEALNISHDFFESQIKKAVNYSPWLPSPFLTQLNKREFAAFQEQMRRFKGFYIQKRYLRDYQTKSAANIFGDIAQVNQSDIDRNPYYKSGDLKGKNGIELAYEEVLKGTKGIKRIQRDKFNRELGPYKDGLYDTLAVRGKDITLTIDLDLQEYLSKINTDKYPYIWLDIKNLTIDRAKYLYEKHYWVPAKCDKFLFPNNIILFDMAVNSGSARAIKTLQKACKVKEDGIVGPQTIGAANKLDFTLFLAERVLFYESLGQFNRYGRGWSRRLFNICIYICKKALERQ